jgi:CheY-like chemotaxis protein
LRSKWAAGKALRAGLALEGVYLNRYVTDEQRGRRPIFIATLWAGASWLFFRVARSTRMTRIWALRSRLEKQPTDLRQNTSYFGDRTLEAIEHKSFNAYVMGRKLPDGSGLDVAERIRSKGNEAPIIFISGYDGSAVTLRAEKLRMFDFLDKPFSRETICSAVKKAIGFSKGTSA